MRLALLIALTMLAFAANSILTRLAVAGGHIDPSGFALLRVLSGALTLAMVHSLRGGPMGLFRLRRLWGALTLAAYMIGFSLAYLTLDAGLGALILFGVVQLSMFTHGALTSAAPNLRQISGAALAFAGLVLALWPGAASVVDPLGAALMVFAGLGWAAYSILGRGAQDPIAESAGNFLLCLPIMLILLPGAALQFSITGSALAILSGAVTSGLGYALWYLVLPQMRGSSAAVVQLSVPVIALAAGALLLGESIGPGLILATLLVLGGIAWALTAPRAPADHR